jgi:hypothetical protein
MVLHFKSIANLPGNIYQQKVLWSCTLSLSVNLCKFKADLTFLSGVSGGYATERVSRSNGNDIETKRNETKPR